MKWLYKLIFVSLLFIFILCGWVSGYYFENNPVRFSGVGEGKTYFSPILREEGLSFLKVKVFYHSLLNARGKVREISLEQFNALVAGVGLRNGWELQIVNFLGFVEKQTKAINFKLINFIPVFLVSTLIVANSGLIVFGWWVFVMSFLFMEIGFFGLGDNLIDQGIHNFSAILGLLKVHHSLTSFDFLLFKILYFFVLPGGFFFGGLVYLWKHVLPRRIRNIEDFLKIDKDKQKRADINIEDIVFKKVPFNIRKKIKKYLKTDKYFLAVSDENEDICIDDDMATQHVHILGPSGVGKTSLGILPLAVQSISKGRGACFIDFKGDDLLKKVAYQKAQEMNKKFYYFSIDPKEISSFYNPLFTGDFASKVDRIMSALNLQYDGSAGFYSKVQSMAFNVLLENMMKTGMVINFENICQALKEEEFLKDLNVKEQEVKGLLASLTTLSSVDIINKDEISLRQIIENEDIVFFALKSHINTELAEAIGRLIIIDLKYQAINRKEYDNNFFIYIDEFQNLATRHFVDVISKVRSCNFCLVLSNQSRGNLLSVDSSFENTIFTNTHTKIIFSQEDPKDAEFWAKKTGTTQYEERGMRMFAGNTFGGDYTILDGKREVESSIQKRTKNFITSNSFLRLPKCKSVIFLRQNPALLSNHEHYFTAEIRGRILREPFPFHKQSLEESKDFTYTEEPKKKRLGQEARINKFLKLSE